MSDEETRMKRGVKFSGELSNRSGRRKPRHKTGPSKSARRLEHWCDDYMGDISPMCDTDELNFNN